MENIESTQNQTLPEKQFINSEIVDNPKVINRWCFYDWANSAYSLIIATTIFPVYYHEVTANGISIGNTNVDGAVVYSFLLSFSFLLIALINPLLSGIADYSHLKKRFMRFFAYLGSISCMLLFFFTKDHIWLGLVFFMLATMGFAGSLVFYNAFLPEIASPEQQDRVSAKGFSLGYIGSLLLMLVNLVMIYKYQWFGFPDQTLATRTVFLTVGIWWLYFSKFSLKHLPVGPRQTKEVLKKHLLAKGYKRLREIWLIIKKRKVLHRFLIAFFCYILGFQTIIYLSTTYAVKAVGIPTMGLMAVILIIQLVAILGAYSFAYLSSKIKNTSTLSIAVVLCIIVSIAAFYISTPEQFYFLAVLIGLMMGGLQSLSRSTYSKLLPVDEEHSAYFSFYEIADKIATSLGTAIYGIIAFLTGNMRFSIIALVIFFTLGLYFLNSVKQLDNQSI